MISLRHYLEALRVADQQALAIARKDIDRRLDAMNELREQITHERVEFMSIDTYEARHAALEALLEGMSKRLTIIELWRANLAGRATALGAIGIVLSAAVGALIGHLLG